MINLLVLKMNVRGMAAVAKWIYDYDCVKIEVDLKFVRRRDGFLPNKI